MNRENLVKGFAKAGLVLKLLKEPITRGRGSSAIFQFDIGREVNGTRRHEWFEMYPGNDSNIIQIMNTHYDSRQLVMMVKEAEVDFEVEVKKSTWPRIVKRNRQEFINSHTRFRETDTHFIITERTTANVRHFLLGLDERQLFVAQLNRAATTVMDAKNALGKSLELFEGKRNLSAASRQGEWFFMKATNEQTRLIEELLSKGLTWITKKVSIGTIHGGRTRGNPHVADEIVVIPGTMNLTEKSMKKAKLTYPIREREVFVRGGIRHVDHKTTKFKRWYQVILNDEGATSGGTASGISWID